MERYDVIIVGGGISGLVAARTLLQHDPEISVALLEGKPSLGGRIESLPVQVEDKSIEVEFGAERIVKSQKYISGLLRDLEIKTNPAPTSLGRHTIQLRNKIVRNKSCSFSWFHTLELQKVLQTLETMCSKVCLLDPYGGRGGYTWDNITFSSWIEENCWQQSVKEHIGSLVRAVLGVEPGQVSLLFLILVAGSSGGVISLFFSPKVLVEGGTGGIISRLEKELENKIYLFTSKRVKSVEQSDSGVLVITEGSDTFRAEKLIICIPPSQQGRISWKPELSPLKSFVQNSTPMGHFIRFVLPFSRAHWEPLGLTGTLFSSGGKPRAGCETGPVTLVFPHISGSGSTLSGCVGGKPAVQWETRSEEATKDAIIENLSELLGSWVHKNKGVYIKTWRGNGVSFAPPGIMHAWPAVRIQEGNLHFGGTAAATTWIGSLEGGVQSGLRTGLEVLRSIRPQSLTAEDLQFLNEFSLDNLDTKSAPTQHVYRWTLFLPLTYLVLMYAAISMRNKYSGLLIPFH